MRGERKDADAMKLERDGWLWAGPKRDMRIIKPVHEFVKRLPDGRIVTEVMGGGGHIVWGPASKPDAFYPASRLPASPVSGPQGESNGG